MTDRHIRLMSHLVAGYPDDRTALDVARALVAGGTSMLEIQLPFSDPSADGTAIQGACADVLSHGYRTKDGLACIARIHREFPDTPLFLMSYASLIYTPGIDHFCRTAAESGVSGIIIPDLPFDHDEGLKDACKTCGMENVPVAAPSMTPARLSKLTNAGYKFIYAALRTGITGSSTTIDSTTLQFLDAVSQGGARVLGGFGITTKKQAEELAAHVYAVVAGSVFVRIISEHAENRTELAAAVESKARELAGR